MITGVHHVGLSVKGLDKTIGTLSGVLPLEVVRRFSITDDPTARALMELADVRADVALVKGPNAYLQLSEFGATKADPVVERPVNAAGITHICIQGRDIEILRNRLAAGGMTFHAPPTDLGTGFLYAYGRDLDGNVVETEGAPFAPGDPEAWFGHVAFATHDLDRLSDFYAALTDVATTMGGRLRDNARYDQVTGLTDVDVRVAWVRVPNLGLEFWQYLNPPTSPTQIERSISDLGYSHICFETDDLNHDRDRAIALGARPHGGIVDLDGARTAYLRDPDGNILALIEWIAEPAAVSVAELKHTDILERVTASRP